jgi:hypothetical protein
MPSKKRKGISFPKLGDIIDSNLQGESGEETEAVRRPIKKPAKKKKTTVVLKREIKDPERFLLRPETAEAAKKKKKKAKPAVSKGK